MPAFVKRALLFFRGAVDQQEGACGAVGLDVDAGGGPLPLHEGHRPDAGLYVVAAIGLVIRAVILGLGGVDSRLLRYGVAAELSGTQNGQYLIPAAVPRFLRQRAGRGADVVAGGVLKIQVQPQAVGILLRVLPDLLAAGQGDLLAGDAGAADAVAVSPAE